MDVDKQPSMETIEQQIEIERHTTSTPNPSIPQKRLQSPYSSQEDAGNSMRRKPSETQHKNISKNRNRPFKKSGSQDKKETRGRGNARKDARDYRPWNNKSKESEDGPKPIYAAGFSKEEIAAEERRPKKKVAVMIGYCGTGYKGLQIMSDVKTVESDIFGALVAAKAVSRANADEPKKVSLMRCARTDKGVHAGGNVLSMKMIIEDKDIVQKINSHLPPQIRIWGIEKTINSFNAYQQCDSRIYEYLIPTHCFLPPHPQTFLARKLEELAEEAGDVDSYHIRQEDAANFWAETEEQYVRPVLDGMDPKIRAEAIKHVFANLEASREDNTIGSAKSASVNAGNGNLTHNGALVEENSKSEESVLKDTAKAIDDSADPSIDPSKIQSPLEQAIRSIKQAHHQAKLAYRINPSRLSRIKSVLALYVGTWRFHNYTVLKRMNDPSCKRHIKSFVVHDEPFLIGETEWLSLKVHGQSFMMNQIRKMVLMAAMIVRCGTHEDRMQDSFNIPKMIIPRAPALGLLLERPIFQAYNKIGRFKGENDRGPIEFDKYEAEMNAFKQKEIYERMWKDEAEHSIFENFFAGLDSLHSSHLLWASSMGLAAIEKKVDGAMDLDADKVLGEEDTAEAGGEEG